jgi:Mrp family chromosome partitioning ATPase
VKRRPTTEGMAREFRFLRTRIESEIESPALIFVTSATERDCAGYTAFGLAESLSRSYQRTALMTTDSTLCASSGVPEATPLRRRASDSLEAIRYPQRGDGTFSLVSISPERLTTMSRSSVAALIKRLRAENDYVVIDAGNLPASSFALLLLPAADAVLVTFRSGRSQQPADRAMLDSLERSEAKMLGVVMTDAGALEEYTHRDQGQTVADLTPRRTTAAGGDPVNITLRQAGKST